ncbi:MAG: endonuclease Q family protein [Alicyclobacillus sp.]|nr:endonuclease Q family protein [Alicyclobacillus sp.]
MAAAPSLTLDHVVAHARRRKGLNGITVIDAVCTPVLAELEERVRDGRLQRLPGGGLVSEEGLVILLGAEVEVAGPHGGAAHFGAWFGHLEAARDFHDWLATVQTNPALSSQRARVDAGRLQAEVLAREGLFVVHHAFTPHKGMYGNCVAHMDEMVDPAGVAALELGLSADTDMADCLSELRDISFITNSDAHSVQKIAREYNVLRVADASFTEVAQALARESGRAVVANHGLHPALGKYHRTACAACGRPWPDGQTVCPCGGKRRTQGVYDRLLAVRDQEHPVHPPHRPPYVHQIPLEFVPGLGPKSLERLFSAFGTEMAILHEASVDDLAEVVGRTLADRIDEARTGRLRIQTGGGGVYGKVLT